MPSCVAADGQGIMPTEGSEVGSVVVEVSQEGSLTHAADHDLVSSCGQRDTLVVNQQVANESITESGYLYWWSSLRGPTCRRDSCA